MTVTSLTEALLSVAVCSVPGKEKNLGMGGDGRRWGSVVRIQCSNFSKAPSKFECSNVGCRVAVRAERYDGRQLT